jgi:plastocyanin
VPPGTAITVINQDPVAHTATAVDGAFNTGQLAPAQRTTIIAPHKPGTYRYLSIDQQYITGFIKVIERPTAIPGRS